VNRQIPIQKTLTKMLFQMHVINVLVDIEGQGDVVVHLGIHDSQNPGSI